MASELNSYVTRIANAMEAALTAVNQGDGYYTDLGMGVQEQDRDGKARTLISEWNDYKGGATAESGFALWVEWGGGAVVPGDVTKMRWAMEFAVVAYCRGPHPRALSFMALADVQRAIVAEIAWWQQIATATDPRTVIDVNPLDIDTDRGLLAYKGLAEVVQRFAVETADVDEPSATL